MTDTTGALREQLAALEVPARQAYRDYRELHQRYEAGAMHTPKRGFDDVKHSRVSFCADAILFDGVYDGYEYWARIPWEMLNDPAAVQAGLAEQQAAEQQKLAEQRDAARRRDYQTYLDLKARFDGQGGPDA
jgi:hypothetical protein